MPELGEIRRGREIDKSPYQNYIWHACEMCGKERWIHLVKGQPVNRLCYNCASIKKRGKYKGERSYNWKGGRRINTAGYVLINLPPDDFFYPMADFHGYVKEHRLVMAKKLGRCLQPWEHIHHVGIRYSDIRNKSDNLEDNLKLTTSNMHSLETRNSVKAAYNRGFQDGLKIRDDELRKEIRLLRLELKQLAEANKLW